MADEKYFNVPVQLMEGFLANDKAVLNKMLYYALYAHSEKMEFGNEAERFAASANYFGVQIGSIKTAIKTGKELFNTTDDSSPMVGINLKVFWDYYKNHKPEFDKACLLAFLALRSILQKKSYCKIDNRFLLARMDGKARSCEFTALSEEVFKYANEYQTKKIKKALSDAWGLVTYSRYTRGFYVSFKLSLVDLVFEAEKRRESVKEKQRKDEVNDALQQARERLGITRS